MTLAKAFKERRRMAHFVSHLRNEIAGEVLYREESEDAPQIDGMTIDEAYNQYVKLSGALTELNVAIDVANTSFVEDLSGRKILQEINEVKNSLALANTMKKRASGFKPTVKTYDQYAFNEKTQTNGDYVTKTYVMSSDIDWTAAVKDLKGRLIILENMIDEFNATCQVSISMDLLNTIASYEA